MLVKTVLILVLAHLCAVCLGLEYEYNNRTGKQYKFHEQGATWDDAKRICEQEGARLAIIKSDVEAEVLTALHDKNLLLIKGSDYIYWAAIGIIYDEKLGSWRTIEGQTPEQAGFNKWNAGHPYTVDGKEFRGYLMLRKLKSSVATDKTAFICEKPEIV